MRINEKKQGKGIDYILIAIVVALVLTGVVFIGYASADPFTGAESSLSSIMAKFDWRTIGLQLLRFAACSAAAIVVMSFDYQVYGQLGRIIFILSVLLLLVVLAFGSTIRGAKAWLQFGGANIQPSELIKITVIIMCAKVAAQACERDGALKSFRDIVEILFYAGTLAVLVILQKDLGTAFVYICVLIGILFAAKLSYRVMLGFAAVGAAGFTGAYFFLFEDWQRARITSFLYPDSDLMGTEYNVGQSKIVIGSGQLTGKGLFSDSSLVQRGFLPEQTTDFIFSSGVEAFGFIGGVIVIALYALLLLRILQIALKAKDYFGSFLCIGVASMMLAHIFENIGMVIGVMPVTGIPLPFISYGGSNFLTNMIAIGLVLNVGMRKPTKQYSTKSFAA